MPPRCPSSFPPRFVLLPLTMALFIGIVVFLLIHFTATSQPGPSYSRAEPVRQGTLVFPFEKELWMNTSMSPRCPKHFFSCANSTCLGLDKRCDGRVDCPSAEDEVNCVCAFRLPAAKFCDQYPDCFDGSDESFCSQCPLAEGAFSCGGGRCVPRTALCDSRPDCGDAADEQNCFRLTSNISSPVEDTSGSPRSGFLLRQQKGAWYPVCANPHDSTPGSLAAAACVAVTANPTATARHHYRRFGKAKTVEYVYHYRGRFVVWRGCASGLGVYVSCSDSRCGVGGPVLPPGGRIVGGSSSPAGAWPWHAALYRNGTYACGATLLNDRWLLSAAHCFLNHRSVYYEVQLGMLRRKSFSPHQRTRALDRVLPHPKFNIVTLEYDIVLLRMASKVTFDSWVRPICLPSRADGREMADGECTAIGWGDLGEMEGDSDELREVRVPLTTACKRNPERWICAGYAEGGRDACQGDSGGPLLCPHRSAPSWYIAGIISAGTGCARPDTPGMYTRVSFFLDWIQAAVSSAEDEQFPPLPSCPGWRCNALGGGNCLPEEKVCDGKVDCYDAADEVDCKGRRKKV